MRKQSNTCSGAAADIELNAPFGDEIGHGGVLETSLRPALYPDLIQLERAVDHEPAGFPRYEIYPPKLEWTPACGTLSCSLF